MSSKAAAVSREVIAAAEDTSAIAAAEDTSAIAAALAAVAAAGLLVQRLYQLSDGSWRCAVGTEGFSQYSPTCASASEALFAALRAKPEQWKRQMAAVDKASAVGLSASELGL